jgi:hypothetical protein
VVQSALLNRVGGVIEQLFISAICDGDSLNGGDSPTGQATDLVAACQECRARYRG